MENLMNAASYVYNRYLQMKGERLEKFSKGNHRWREWGLSYGY